MSPQERILTSMNQAIEWQLIDVGISSDIFNLLQRPKSAEALATTKQWGLDKTLNLLLALTGMGILEKVGTEFVMHCDYKNLLSARHQQSMAVTLQHLSRIKLTTTDGFIELMADNALVNPSRLTLNSEAFWRGAAANLRSFHASTSAVFYAELLQQLPQWSQITTLLDLGAGSSILGRRLVEENTQLHYHLFDLPQVTTLINNQPESGHSRIFIHGGDYNQTVLPMNMDVIFSAMSLYYATDLDELLTRCHGSLSKTGIFVSIHEGLTHARTQPQYHVTSRILPAIQGNDLSFEQGHIAQCLLRAGFRQVASQLVDTPFGPLNVDIGYK